MASENSGTDGAKPADESSEIEAGQESPNGFATSQTTSDDKDVDAAKTDSTGEGKGKALSYRESRELKRLEANRVRARDRRKRDKVMWNQMQQKIVLLSQENGELKQRNHMLEAELGRMYRQQSGGAGSMRDAHMRGMMPPLDGMQGGMPPMPPMGMQRPPMGHLDAGYDMPGAGRPGMGGPPGYQGYGYGDLGGRGRFMGPGGGPPPPAGTGMPEMDRIRQQQLFEEAMADMPPPGQGYSSRTPPRKHT